MGLMGVAEIFFILDIVADLYQLDIATQWIEHNTLEFSAVALLFVSLLLLGLQVRKLLEVNRAQTETVKVASGKLLGVIEDRFNKWKLSASEKEVALLLIKGLSIQEIADLRNTKLGTVKSQSSMIYQKAGLQNRSELASYFVEDLLAGEAFVEQERTE